MGSGVKGGVSRVSIPSGVKKTIENIKEITGQNHSEDDIYALLKECDMDPNETTQKLLLLDTFHEVKRKRDRRKENISKEPAESKWKPGPQARVNRVSQGDYSPRYEFQGARGGRNMAVVKKYATNHLTEMGAVKVPLPTAQDMRKKENPSFARSTTVASNGPSSITSQITNALRENHGEGIVTFGSIKNTDAVEVKDIKHNQILDSSNSSTSVPSPPAAGSYLSSPDIVPLPSKDLCPLTVVGTIQCELGIHDASTEQLDYNLTESKPKPASGKISASKDGSTNLEQKVPNESQGVVKNQDPESLQTARSVNRPSSIYNDGSQVIVAQKVGPGKEWKPKSINPHIGQAGNTAASAEVFVVSGRSHSKPLTTHVLTSKETTLELQRKLEDTYISDRQHVIIPNNRHIPEFENLGFCFGSFDASFGLDLNQNGVSEPEKSPLMLESTDPVDTEKELQLSNQDALVAVEDTDAKYLDLPQSRSQGQENFPTSEVEILSPVNNDHNESMPEVALGSHPHPVVHTSNYSFGFVPPTLGGQLAPSASSESQTRDASRTHGFVMPQYFDPASYYAQFYRSGLDSDGRISPFQLAGPAKKYAGNAPAQTSHTQELQGSVPLILSTASQTPLVTQAAGVVQNSMTSTQQPHPVCRQSSGVHLPHYPPNYMPYGPYFSPFYVPPPPVVHQFLSNGSFPQGGGGFYQSVPGANAKFQPSQYRRESNTGGPVHIGVPGNYGLYGVSMPNYTSGSATSVATSTSNEDIAASQAKENTGQQNEGSGVWSRTPDYDISGLQAGGALYNLPQGHRYFTDVFHRQPQANVHPLPQQSQAITNSPTVDMVGPTLVTTDTSKLGLSNY